MKNLLIKATVLVTAFYVLNDAQAACSVLDFAIKDYSNIIYNDKMSLATLSLLTQDQYEKSKHDFSTAGSYAYIFSGSTNYNDFKEKINKELAYSSYKYDDETSLNYVSQHLSPQVNDLYSTCMKNDSSVLGLRIWLVKKTASYYDLGAEWIGGASESVGELQGHIEDGLTIVSPLQKEWPRAFTYDILVKKTNSAGQEAAIVLTVNGDSANFIIVPDPPIEEFDLRPVTVPAVEIHSGGFWQAGTQSTSPCASPPEGARWVPGTGKISNATSTDTARTTATVKSQDEFSMCWTISANTGDRDVTVTQSAGLTALARFPRKKLSTNTSANTKLEVKGTQE